jgi:hypothetical protein
MAGPNLAAILDETAQRAADAYWKAKDLDAAIALLQDGIRRGLASSDIEVLGKVKAMSFNLASFTWPGWDDPGIAISPEHLKIGQAAAELNHRLALQLNRPQDKVAVAHWMIGAHALPAGQLERALQHFAHYRDLAGDDTNRHVADGYIAIAHLLAGRDENASFDQAVAALRAVNSEDSNFYADQLLTVRRVMLSSHPATNAR